MAGTMSIPKVHVRNNYGLTLIELVVALTILSVLSAIVALNLQSSAKSARIAACKVDWRTVSAALNSYYNDNDSTAGTMGDLVTGGYLADYNGSIAGTNSLSRSGYTILIASGRIGVKIASTTLSAPYSNSIGDCSNVR